MDYSRTLYSTDSKDKIRQWSIKTFGHTYIVQHGIKDGKLQEKITQCKPKNIGKSNETTGVEQAILEAQAKWTFQVQRDDYHWDVTKANRQIRPMLAMDYLKVPHRVKWEQAIAQPKLDGVRLTYGRRYRDESGHEAMTRKGENYTLPHLTEPTIELLAIINSLCGNQCLALDGEAYIHGMSLQNIMRLVKKYRPGETEIVQYYLFDLVIPGMEFHNRHELLRRALDIYNDQTNIFQLVKYDIIINEEDMKFIHGKYTEQGYEGLMIRHRDSEYGIAKRSADLFKYKHFMDDEALIKDVWEDNNGNAMFTVEQKNGMSCKVTPKRTHEERKTMLVNKADYIGKWITCKFQTYTDENIMQFPIGLALRKCNEFGEPIA
jgi:ATP-dependent DNA ligase